MRVVMIGDVPLGHDGEQTQREDQQRQAAGQQLAAGSSGSVVGADKHGGVVVTPYTLRFASSWAPKLSSSRQLPCDVSRELRE